MSQIREIDFNDSHGHLESLEDVGFSPSFYIRTCIA